MSRQLRHLLMGALPELRHEPLAQRVRGEVGGVTVVDTNEALLVWEPTRVVPTYAVPEADVRAALRPAGPSGATGGGVPPMGAPPELAGRPVLDPSVPFAVHTAAGEPLDLVVGDVVRPGAAFRPADPDLAGHLHLDFDALDRWLEEDEEVLGHPRDPFHRVDAVPSGRHVRVEHDGVVLADSRRPVLVLEPPLPVRAYLPPEDVRLDLLERSATATTCAYKGRAVHLSAPGVPDVAWSYPEPARGMELLRDRVCFYDEHVDVVLDGVRRGRPVTPWSRR